LLQHKDNPAHFRYSGAMHETSAPEESALDQSVAEVLTRWPAAAQVLLAFRMACVGCNFSAFDTTRDALRIHGIGTAEFLQRLRPILQTSPGVDAQPTPAHEEE